MSEERAREFANVPVMWEPVEGSGRRVKEFMKQIEIKYKVQFKNYWDLHKWSIENLVQFWEELWAYAGIIHSQPYRKVIDLSVPMYESTEWFEGARMNFAENLLRFRDDHIALIVAGEDRDTEKLTYAKMYEETKLYAAAFRKHGVKEGDRVSCFMPNRKEPLLAMLATTSIGAIWLGALPLMGSEAVINRFKQVQPKLLFTVDRYSYNREEIEMLSKVKEIANGLPSLEKVIIAPSKPESKLKDISDIRNSCFLDDFLETGKNLDGSVPEMVFEQLPLSHPIFINYTSGTTGLPKALLHGAGMILSMAKDFWLHMDGDRNRCSLSSSPVGWASWNMFAVMHYFGCTLVLFEGLPYFLSPTFLWDMIDEFQITNMFLPPTVLDELEKKGYLPTKHNHLSSLNFISSGGSVVKPQNYEFVYKLKENIVFSSFLGCTEFMGSIFTFEQSLKIHRGEIPAPSLGSDILCVNVKGKPVLGEIGELVINNPSPSLPLGLWGDSDGSVFRKAYFDKYPGKFCLGDLAVFNPITRGVKIFGRSDDTLNPRGCRFGSSDIYNIVVKFPEVLDSLCVSQYNKNKDERAVLFLKMNDGHPFNENIVKRLRDAIARELSARHVPEVILETADIPINMNGKKMEILVKNIINRMPFNSETVRNPECLANFMDVPELRGF